jgi:hypothetical protein
MMPIIAGLLGLVLVITGCGETNVFRLGDTGVSNYVRDERAHPVTFAGTEPQGFKSLEWKTKLSACAGMKYLRSDPTYGGIDFYSRGGDEYNLGNGRSLPVQYGFWKGQFYVAMLVTQGQEDWNALRSAVFQNYGLGAKPFVNKEEYLWEGKQVRMALGYNELSRTGTFYVRSEAVISSHPRAELWE